MTNDEAKSVLFDMLGKGIYVKDTKENQAILVALRALEQDASDDVISRQAALDTFGLSEKSRKYGGDHSGYDTIMLYEVLDALEALPSVTPQSKTGHWIKYGVPRCGEQHYQCTLCKYYINFGQWGEVYTKQFKYCPNCGAKMIEPQESEDKG